MNRIFDKLVVLACCAVALARLPVDAAATVSLCAGVTAGAACEFLWQRRSDGAWAPAAALLALALLAPAPAAMAPLALYDMVRTPTRSHAGALACGAVLGLGACARYLSAPAARGVGGALLPLLALLAMMLSLRSNQYERERGRRRRMRDSLRGRMLSLEERNSDLVDRRGYEIELATLAERARIAREIHDNVGHQLTRVKLQAEALRVVHAGDGRAAADFGRLAASVDDALEMVRSSVHALNDDAADLSVQLAAIVRGFDREGGPHAELEVSAENVPAGVAACFAAVVREALSNVARHAHASRVSVRCLEHPSFYQLIVLDDGAGPVSAPQTGMGLDSMRERVEALGGAFRAGPRGDVPGWRVFATVPKTATGGKVLP